MAELIAEVLALHNTLHTHRSQTESVKLERDRLSQSQDVTNKRCKQLEEEAARLHQMLACRNSALSQELGLQTSYNKCLAELAGQQSPFCSMLLSTSEQAVYLRALTTAESNNKIEAMSTKTEQEVNDAYCKLKDSEAKQAHLASMLSTEKQAHSAAVARFQLTQQESVRAAQELKAKVKLCKSSKDALCQCTFCHNLCRPCFSIASR